MSDPIYFGYEQVSPDEKTRRVRGVFDSVAHKYDVMNDLMSAGMHRGWKRFTVALSGVRAGGRVLDLAGGTGDLAKLFAQRAGPSGTVVHTDINGAMLAAGRDKLIDAGHRVADGAVQRGSAAVSRPLVRLRVDRLRLAQRHAQGARARRNGARAGAGRRRAGAGVLARRASARARSTIGTASTFCRFSDDSSSTTRRATAISPSRSACIRIRKR